MWCQPLGGEYLVYVVPEGRDIPSGRVVDKMGSISTRSRSHSVDWACLLFNAFVWPYLAIAVDSHRELDIADPFAWSSASIQLAIDADLSGSPDSLQ